MICLIIIIIVSSMRFMKVAIQIKLYEIDKSFIVDYKPATTDQADVVLLSNHLLTSEATVHICA